MLRKITLSALASAGLMVMAAQMAVAQEMTGAAADNVSSCSVVKAKLLANKKLSDYCASWTQSNNKLICSFTSKPSSFVQGRIASKLAKCSVSDAGITCPCVSGSSSSSSSDAGASSDSSSGSSDTPPTLSKAITHNDAAEQF